MAQLLGVWLSSCGVGENAGVGFWGSPSGIWLGFLNGEAWQKMVHEVATVGKTCPHSKHREMESLRERWRPDDTDIHFQKLAYLDPLSKEQACTLPCSAGSPSSSLSVDLVVMTGCEWQLNESSDS